MVKPVYDDDDGAAPTTIQFQDWCHALTPRRFLVSETVKENRLAGALTFDRVRFLGTSRMSICRSGGSGMPKEKPPYLQESVFRLETTSKSS